MKRKLMPDNRLDWRDINMPVLRIAKPENGGNWGVYEFSSDMIHKYHERAMISPRIEPMWKDDPSYWWSKKNK